MNAYHWRQNNSGGVFQPPALHVVIEAPTIERALEVFGAIDKPGRDCTCCGPRWDDDDCEQVDLAEFYPTPHDDHRSGYAEDMIASDGVPLVLVVLADGRDATIGAAK